MTDKPLSATDAISPALARTKKNLFQPFRVSHWMKMSLVTLLSSELAVQSCRGKFGNLDMNGAGGGRRNPFPNGLGPEIAKLGSLGPHQILIIASVVAVSVLFVVALALLFLYLYARFRFILMDTVLFGECRIGDGWHRYRIAGQRLFGFHFVMLLVNFAVFVVVLGVPIFLMIQAGIFRNAVQHPLVLVGSLAVPLSLLFLYWMFVALLFVFAKDFVVPVMAFENAGVGRAFRSVWTVVAREKSSFAFYILMKIVLAIVAAVLLGIILLMVLLVLLIPIVLLGVLLALAVKGMGTLGVAVTITAVVVLGILGGLFVIWLVSFLSVPAAIFFESYALYFLGSRYPLLGSIMTPVAPSGGGPPIPRTDTPPIAPTPTGNPGRPPLSTPGDTPHLGSAATPGPDISPDPASA